VECQTIRVPTGVQDYRPALFGGIAAIELRVDGIRRIGLSVDHKVVTNDELLNSSAFRRNKSHKGWRMAITRGV